MTIDIHAHAIPDTLLRELRAGAPDLAPQVTADGGDWYVTYPFRDRRSKVPLGMIDVGERLVAMNSQGIDLQALSVGPSSLMYWIEDHAKAADLARLHNEALVQMAKSHPSRFVVLGTLPLQSPDHSIAVLQWLTRQPEVVGLQLGTNANRTALDHPSLADLWAAVARSGLAVVLHPFDVAGAERMADHHLRNLVGNPADTTLAAGSLVFGGVLARHPELRIALVHGGGFLPYQWGRFLHGWRVRPELRAALPESPATLLAKLYFDSLTHDSASLRFLVERVSAERVCLGTDYPFDMADQRGVESVRGSGLDESAQELILQSNAQRLLGLAEPSGREAGLLHQEE